MANQQSMLKCEKCKKKTLHTRTTPNIILHIFLSIVSLGFWFLIYLLFIHKGRPQCMTCGKGYGDTYSDLAKKIDKEKNWIKKFNLYLNKKILIPVLIILILLVIFGE